MATQRVAGSIVRRIIKTDKAPAAVGPYNQAVQVGNTLYLSGTVALSPDPSKMPHLTSADVVEQAHQTLKNIGEVLKAAGATYNNVVKTTVLLTDINDYQKVNEVYGQYFTDKLPARSAYAVSALPKGFKVEIEAIAVVGDIVDEN